MNFGQSDFNQCDKSTVVIFKLVEICVVTIVVFFC